MKIECTDLTIRFGSTTAIDKLSLTLAAGKIHGLLGRNGAGKTSLLSVLSAFRKASGGQVRVGGHDPFENAAIMGDICFVRDRLDAPGSERVSAVLNLASRLRPNWDAAYAAKLTTLFEVPLRRKVSQLSRGQMSAVAITLGLAARAPLTIFDESYLGLDAPSRYAFYQELLNDYLATPRTIILSTHLIEEVGSLFEDVVMIDRGGLLLHEDAESLRERGATVTGPAEAVDRYIADLTVLSERRLGPTKSAAVIGPFGPQWHTAARALGLELGPIGLQDLFVHLTSPEGRRSPHRVAIKPVPSDEEPQP